MKPVMLLLGMAILVMGCSGPRVCGFKQTEIDRSFVPLPGYQARAAVPCEHVVFLEAAPTDRKYREIGLISPRGSKQKSWADAVRAGLAAGAQRGADAVFPVSETEKDTWGFMAAGGGAIGGKKNYVVLRLKAIVYE